MATVLSGENVVCTVPLGQPLPEVTALVIVTSSAGGALGSTIGVAKAEAASRRMTENFILKRRIACEVVGLIVREIEIEGLMFFSIFRKVLTYIYHHSSSGYQVEGSNLETILVSTVPSLFVGPRVTTRVA